MGTECVSLQNRSLNSELEMVLTELQDNTVHVHTTTTWRGKGLEQRTDNIIHSLEGNWSSRELKINYYSCFPFHFPQWKTKIPSCYRGGRRRPCDFIEDIILTKGTKIDLWFRGTVVYFPIIIPSHNRDRSQKGHDYIPR